MTRTLRGTIRNGQVELVHVPEDAEGAEVVVTVLDASAVSALTRNEARDQVINELIDQMRRTQVSGGRGYLFREELHDRRVIR